MRGASVLTLCLLLLCAAPAAAETITIVGDPWCPYNCEPDSDRPGFGIEIAKEVFTSQWLEVRYQTLSWEEALEGTRKGAYTAVIGASREDAPDFVFPEREVGSSSDIFVTRAGDPWKYASPESLTGRRVGAIKAYSYGEVLDAWFAQHPPAVEVEGEDPKGLLMKKLLAKEIDVFVEDRAVMIEYARSRGVLRLLDFAGSPEEATPVYIAFSPANPKSAAYARQLSEGIERLERSGRLRAILGRYNLAH